MADVPSSLSSRFRNVAELLAARGGRDSHVIQKILIANNGIAAVKAIRSIRQWSYDMFGNDREVGSMLQLTLPFGLRSPHEPQLNALRSRRGWRIRGPAGCRSTTLIPLSRARH